MLNSLCDYLLHFVMLVFYKTECQIKNSIHGVDAFHSIVFITFISIVSGMAKRSLFKPGQERIHVDVSMPG